MKKVKLYYQMIFKKCKLDPESKIVLQIHHFCNRLPTNFASSIFIFIFLCFSYFGLSYGKICPVLWSSKNLPLLSFLWSYCKTKFTFVRSYATVQIEKLLVGLLHTFTG